MRYELHRTRLNKEVHTWKKIVQEAELIEMADLENELGVHSKNKSKANHQNEYLDSRGQQSNQNSSKKFKRKWKDNKPFTYQGRNNHNLNERSKNGDSSSPKINHSSSFQRKPANGGNKDFTPKVRLSDEKKVQYDAQELCYGCGEKGHFSRNCPQKNTVRSSKKGPPGLQAHAMSYPTRDNEWLAQLAQTTELAHEISLNMISLESLTDSISEVIGFEYLSDNGSASINSDEIPPLQPVSDSDDEDGKLGPGIEVTHPFGDSSCPSYSESDPEGEDQVPKSESESNRASGSDDAGIPMFTVNDDGEPISIDDWVSIAARFVLNHDGPYPGDETWWGAETSYRFHVYQLNENTYAISDSESAYGELTITTEKLLDPTFKLSAWYAEQRAWLLHCPFDASDWQETSTEISDVYEKGLKFVLTCGIPAYPKGLAIHGENLDPFERFEVFKVDSSAEGLNEQYYYFIDQENMLSSENTKFNLVGWWRKRLDRWLPKQRELASQIRMRVNHPRGNRKKVLMQNHQKRIWRSQRQGDLLVAAVKMRLCDSQPYPGDKMSLTIHRP
ncbi:hypothetical protein EV359DRAFT_68537 [Lentinula novae-zelandiae]|nr:hypothetical protein EV359DRAFT_68537 [Lentinula novae-zelandiae]